MNNLISEVIWWVKRIPATILFILFSLIVGVTTKALWVSAETSGLVEKLGYGLPAFKSGDIVSIFTGLLVAPAPWMYALILIPLAIGGGYIEYKYGTLKMLATLFLTHVAAVIIVALLLFILEPSKLDWVVEFANLRDVGLSNAGFGALGAMTAAFSRLWRRRIRTIAVLYCIAFILFSGAIWDLTHFAALLVGFAIGPWVVGRKTEKVEYKLGLQEARNFVATLALFFAITRIVAKVYPGNGGLLEFHNYDPKHSGTILFTIALSIICIALAYGLYAGRKVAWYLSVVATSFIFIAACLLPIRPLTAYNIIFSGVMLVSLIVFRKSFRVIPDKITSRKLYKRLAVVAGLLFIFNTLGIYSIRSSFSPKPSFSQAANESIYQIIGVSSREFTPETKTARYFTNSISLFWLTFVLFSLVAIIFVTVRARDERDLYFKDYDRLLHEKGCSNIGWMARWDGMSYWTNLSKTAGFAYRLENNFAIVLSDPVGSRQAVSASIQSFVNMCERRGWHPVYFSVTDSFRRSVKSQKLKSVMVGEDTIIDLAQLEFKGKPWQSVRSAINLATKQGINMRVVKYSEAPVGLRDQLKAIANSWVEDKSLPEMGFTLGTLKEAEDPEVRMHIAIDEDGTVHGMTSWFPVYKKGKITGWTIDIMQRRLDKDTMRGVIEYLIAESALAFKQEGYDFISLSAAPLSHEGKSTNSVEKLLDVVAERMEPYYGFKSLYNFKKKFNPRHEPMYLCYYDEVRLPSIAVAIGKAYMPEHAVREVLSSKIKPKSKKTK